MKAWIASRRLLAAEEPTLPERWSGLRKPDGASALFLLRNDEDPSEVLEVSLWPDEQRLGKYRAALAAGTQAETSATSATAEWRRSYTVKPVASGHGLWRFWPALPTLAAMVTAAGLVARSRQPQPPLRAVRGLYAGQRMWLALPSLLAAAAGGWFVLRDRLGSSTPTEEARPSGQATQPPFSAAPLVGPGMPAARSATSSRLLVRDVMTPNPETIDYEADLGMAAAKMRDLNIGVLPVLADRQVAGMITDRDIALCVAEGGEATGSRRVYEVMSQVPVTTRPDATVQDAAAVMAAQQVRRLPVVDGTELLTSAEGAKQILGDVLHRGA